MFYRGVFILYRILLHTTVVRSGENTLIWGKLAAQ